MLASWPARSIRSEPQARHRQRSATSARRPQVAGHDRPPRAYTLPPALIQRAELVTKVSARPGRGPVGRPLRPADQGDAAGNPPAGRVDAVDRVLDDQPTKPQMRRRTACCLACRPRSARRAASCRSSMNRRASRWASRARSRRSRRRCSSAPRAPTPSAKIPQADLQWQLILPSGYSRPPRRRHRLHRQIPEREMRGHEVVAAFLYELAGGYRPWYSRRAELSSDSVARSS